MRTLVPLVLLAGACSAPSIETARVDRYSSNFAMPEVVLHGKNIQAGDQITFKSFSYTHPSADHSIVRLPVELFESGPQHEQLQITREGKERVLDFDVDVPSHFTEPYMRLSGCLSHAETRRTESGTSEPDYMFSTNDVSTKLLPYTGETELSCGVLKDGKLHLEVIANHGATLTATVNGASVPVVPHPTPHRWLNRIVEIDAQQLIGELQSASLNGYGERTVPIEITHSMDGHEPVTAEVSLTIPYSFIRIGMERVLIDPEPGSALQWISTDNPTSAPRTVVYNMDRVIDSSYLYGQKELFGVASKGSANLQEVDRVVHAEPKDLRFIGNCRYSSMGDYVPNNKKVYDIEAVAYDLQGEEIGRKTFRGPKSVDCPDSISAPVGEVVNILGGPKAEAITDWALSLSTPS